MSSFSIKSHERLSTCHIDIQRLFERIVIIFDCTILQGHRNEEDQERYFKAGVTKVQWPNSKHNKKISEAIDAVPFPINWKDRERFHYFAGTVKGMAHMMGIHIRWGGDWDNDTEVDDNRFDDLPHYELL